MSSETIDQLASENPEQIPEQIIEEPAPKPFKLRAPEERMKLFHFYLLSQVESLIAETVQSDELVTLMKQSKRSLVDTPAEEYSEMLSTFLEKKNLSQIRRDIKNFSKPEKVKQPRKKRAPKSKEASSSSEPEPEPVSEPEPEPVREPVPEPVREPVPEPVSEPVPEKKVRKQKKATQESA
jgi:hypothetical protein